MRTGSNADAHPAHALAPIGALRDFRLPPVADLFSTDAQLYGAAGDVRGVGPDLWATDRLLFVTRQDIEADDLEHLKRTLRANAVSAFTIPPAATCASAMMPGRGDALGREKGEDVESTDTTCPICLGEMHKTGSETEDDAHDAGVVRTPCGHMYHVRCILAAVDAGGDSCPTCRRPMLEAFRRGGD